MANLRVKEKGLSVFIFLVSVSSLFAGQFIHGTSNLPYDESVHYGQLENGMRYAIMKNDEPPAKATFRLLVQAGSLQEEESQRGLAHFLEHMAFNGSTNYPPGELITVLQNLGMDFGNHTNAHTSFDETVYKLELPRNDRETLTEGFKVMRDYADGLLLLDKEIESERGVILNEKNARDSVGYRTYEKTFAHLFPETRFKDRFPIGLENIIKESKRSDFVHYYKKWYRPDNSAFIAVGDFEVEEIESMIAEYFSSWENPDEAIEPINLGQVSKRPFQTFYHYEEEATETSVSLLSLKPFQDGSDSKARRVAEIKDSLISLVLNRRLSKLAKEEDSVFKKANFYIYSGFNFYQITEIEVSTEPENWEESIAVVEQELRRTMEFGFNEDELEIARKQLINSYEQATRSAGSRQSRSLAVGLRSALSDHRVFTSPKQDEELAKEVLSETNVKHLRDHLQRRWEDGEEHLLITGNTLLEEPDRQISEAFEKSKLIVVEAPEVEEQKTFLYSKIGEPGTIIKDTRDEDLHVRQLVLSNQVRVNLLTTDFEEDVIHMSLQFGGGQLDEKEEQAGLARLASMTFIEGGLVGHSVEELRSIFAGKTAALQFVAGADHFQMSGLTNRKDSHILFQKAASYLSYPGFREEAIRQAKKSIDAYYKKLETTVAGVMSAQVNPFLMQGNHRTAIPPRENLESFTANDLAVWLKDILQSSYLEIAVVGDFEEEVVLEQIVQIFGALPKREPAPKVYVDERAVTFPEKTFHKEFSYQSTLPRAFAGVYWPTTDQDNVFLARRLNMLSRVMDDRLRVEIREKYGDAYSPYAYSNSSTVFDGYGYLTGVSQVTPGTSGRVSKEIMNLGSILFAEGITQDQFDRAKKPLLSSLADYRRRNSYWLERVVLGSQADPLKLYWAKNMVEDYEQMTLEEVNALVKAYLRPDKAVRVEVFPEGTVENVEASSK